jgi:hypothetical protein
LCGPGKDERRKNKREQWLLALSVKEKKVRGWWGEAVNASSEVGDAKVNQE